MPSYRSSNCGSIVPADWRSGSRLVSGTGHVLDPIQQITTPHALIVTKRGANNYCSILQINGVWHCHISQGTKGSNALKDRHHPLARLSLSWAPR